MNYECIESFTKVFVRNFFVDLFFEKIFYEIVGCHLADFVYNVCGMYVQKTGLNQIKVYVLGKSEGGP